MPDSKITDLTSLTIPSNNDVLPIVDVGNDTTKKIAISSLGDFFNTTVNSNSGNWGVAGTGTEIQFKNGSVFGAVSGSSVDSVSGIVTFREIRVNNSNPLTGPRIASEGNNSIIWFHGTTLLNNTNPYLWSGAGSSIINARGSLFRVEGVNGSSSTATLAIGGATLRSPSSNVLTLGSVDATSPLPQTISVQSAAGSANAAGSLFSIEGSQSTGNAWGGDIRFRVSPASAIGGSTVNSLTDVLRIKSNRTIQISNLTSDPLSNIENGDLYYSTSGSSFRYYNVAVGGWRSIASLNADGSFSAPQLLATSNGFEVAGVFTLANSTWGNRLNSSQTFNWAVPAGLYSGLDLSIRRAGANNLALGPLDYNNTGGSTSVLARFLSAQTISVQNAATGMVDAVGAVFTIDGSRSTGNALGGDIRFRTANASTVPANSATQNTLNEVFRIKGNRTVNFAALPSDPTGSVGGDVYYNSTFNSLELFNGTAFVPVNTTRTIATFTALENHPVSANFATLNTRNFDNVGVLQFAAGATIREARFISVIPDNAVLANGLLIRTQFSTITATSGSCRWGAQIKKLSSTSYAASAGIDVTVSGTANQTTMTGTITLPSIDSLAAGDAYALRIFRESNNVADTLIDSAQLLTVEVRTNI